MQIMEGDDRSCVRTIVPASCTLSRIMEKALHSMLLLASWSQTAVQLQQCDWMNPSTIAFLSRIWEFKLKFLLELAYERSLWFLNSESD